LFVFIYLITLLKNINNIKDKDQHDPSNKDENKIKIPIEETKNNNCSIVDDASKIVVDSNNLPPEKGKIKKNISGAQIGFSGSGETVFN
jgi:hypothetical protein